MNKDQLVAAFTELGAHDPEGWAASQIEEGIPQLHRFGFLKEAWNGVVSTNNQTWIDTVRAEDGPAADALNRLIALGAKPSDLTKLVRAMQIETLSSVSFALDCPEPLEFPGDTLAWNLFAVDENGAPGPILHSLHESVPETDPELIP